MRRVSWCLCLAMLVACDRQPGSLQPTSALRDPLVTSHVSVTGPDAIAPGLSAQYHATLTTSDGKMQDVTQDSSWLSLAPGLLTASASSAGIVAAAFARGEGNVRATYKGNQAQVHLYVLDAGTHALHGTVRDDKSPTPGATVQVTSGVGAGLTTVVGTDGRYTLYGVAGPITIAATLDGYVPATRTVDIEDNNENVDLSLALEQPRSDVSGSWRFTFTASDSCTGLPADAKQRTYPLQITQHQSLLQMQLTLLRSAWGFPDPIPINGTLVADTLRFAIHEDVVDGPDIYELLDDGRYFSLGGSGVGQANGATIDGTLHGELRIYPDVDCVGDHRFHMER